MFLKAVAQLLRQIGTGDISAKNIALVQHALMLFETHRSWTCASPPLLAQLLYTLLRLIPDHGRTQLAELREREVAACSSLLRQRFADVRMLGRELVRLLQDVARLAEFEEIWRLLLHRPQSLSAGAAPVNALLAVRANARFVQSRISHEQETQLLFLLRNVKFGQHRRYQLWFAQRHLATADHEPLLVDLVRWVVCCFHPSNRILSSDVVPRWALIGWLLRCIRSPHIAANARLALFADWLCFDARQDSIMLIEPGMLLLFHRQALRRLRARARSHSCANVQMNTAI